MCEFKQQLWSINMIPNDILFEKNKRLEQALEKIKEIAANHQFPVCEYDGFWILHGVKKQILEIVSEVIDD